MNPHNQITHLQQQINQITEQISHLKTQFKTLNKKKLDRKVSFFEDKYGDKKKKSSNDRNINQSNRDISVSGIDQNQQETDFIKRIFQVFILENRCYLYVSDLFQIIYNQGLLDHPAIQNFVEKYDSKSPDYQIYFQEFLQDYQSNFLLRNIINRKQIIPDFQSFENNFKDCFKRVIEEYTKFQNNRPTNILPSLSEVDDCFSASFCTIGQFFIKMDKKPLQDNLTSTLASKVYQKSSFMQCVMKKWGNLYIFSDDIYKYIGREPSGQNFSTSEFDYKNRPHNALCTSGAIMLCSLLIHHEIKFKDIIGFFQEACYSKDIIVDFKLCHEKKMLSFEALGLLNLMIGTMLPKYEDNDLRMQKALEALDLYFQIHSICVNTSILSNFGAMLANNGQNPLTNKIILKNKTAKNINSLMILCGMGQQSCQFVKQLGLPSIFSISGAMITLIPQIGAIVAYSPFLNQHKIPQKGCCLLFNLKQIYSNFSIFSHDNAKVDVTKICYVRIAQQLSKLFICLKTGDLDTIKILKNTKQNIFLKNYNQRGPLHKAVIFNQYHIAEYYIINQANLNEVDIYGHTPLDYASDQKIINLLQKYNAKSNRKCEMKFDLTQKTVDELQLMLFWATVHDDIPSIQLFLIQGANVQYQAFDGQNALDVAVYNNSLKATKFYVNQLQDSSEMQSKITKYLKDIQQLNQSKKVFEFLEDHLENINNSEEDL